MLHEGRGWISEGVCVTSGELTLRGKNLDRNSGNTPSNLFVFFCCHRCIAFLTAADCYSKTYRLCKCPFLYKVY